MDRKHVPHVPTITLALAMAVLAGSAARGSDGQLDTTFGAVRIAWDYGGSHNDRVSDVVADDSTDSLYLVGYLASETTDDDWGVVRIDAQGNQVRRRLFFDRGGTNDDFATAAYLDGNGHLLVAGWVTTSTPRRTTFSVVSQRILSSRIRPSAPAAARRSSRWLLPGGRGVCSRATAATWSRGPSSSRATTTSA